ncbi:MAG: hypothetical protein QOI56_1014, partial [Actinomycetota bacterium]|nr:hypothetical protein [Actinomycetota bacterium]
MGVMRARRTSGLLLAVAVSVALAVGGPSPAAAGPARSGPGPARSGPSGPSGPSGGQDWSLAGRPCRLIATATVAALAGAGACPGVRPGAVVLTPVGQCTLNFLWRGSDGRSYIGTAGHCLLEGADQTQVVFAPGDGPPARDSAGRRIG